MCTWTEAVDLEHAVPSRPRRVPATGPVTLVDNIPHTTCSSSFVATDGLQQRTSASYRLGRRPTPKEKVPSDRFRYVLNPSLSIDHARCRSEAQPRHDHPARSPSAVPAHDGDLFASATAEDPVPGLHRPPVRRVKRLHATTTSPPPTYSHHVIICHNHLRAASGKGISGSARHDTHDRHSSHPSMLLARRSRRAADYKAAHEGHLNCHQGCQHSNTDQGKDVGGNCREVALVPRNKGCEQRFHGRSILLDFT